MGFSNAGGNSSNRHRAGSKGKRGRPISAYPVPHSYPGQFSHIGESVESTTQASHLSKFTYNMAKNNASRKQYVPLAMEQFDKERLYSEMISLKKQRNDATQQVTILKTSLKAAETDLRKKDAVIAQLTNEIKVGANHSLINNIGLAAYPNMANTGSFFHQPFDALSVSRHQKQSQ